VDAVLLPFFNPAAQVRAKAVLLPHSHFRPGDGDAMITVEGLDPTLLVVGASSEHIFADFQNFNHLTEVVRHVLGPGEPGEIAVNAKVVETVINKDEQIGKELCEEFHRNFTL